MLSLFLMLMSQNIMKPNIMNNKTNNADYLVAMTDVKSMYILESKNTVFNVFDVEEIGRY